jgi:hypothetical protein
MDKAERIINEIAVHESLRTQETITISAGSRRKLSPLQPFAVLLKHPPKNVLLHIRRDGQFFLRVVGAPQFALPFGQDRLIPLWIATLAVK